MIISNETRALVINEALPYIREYSGKVVVIKYGGAAMQNEELQKAVISDIVLLSIIGIKIVLVHGGGPEINAVLKKIGKEPKFIDGYRYTDEETMEVVQMTLCGKINKNLTSLITKHGGKGIGLCGLDNKLIMAKKKESEPDLGFVGDITDINPEPIENALNNGCIPVIATVAADENNVSYNINADIAAAQISAAMKASNLILMTDVIGLLRDKNDEKSLIQTVRLSDIPGLKKEGIIQGGMIPKIECCIEAVRQSVEKANIIDGRIPHSVLLELLTDEGAGTMIVR